MIWHPPRAHQWHDRTLKCACAILPADVYHVCLCGAAYRLDIVDFTYFTCYDCGRRTWFEQRAADRLGFQDQGGRLT